MARIIGDTGLVTSWAGTENSALITGGSAPAAFTLNVNAASADTTPLGASAMTYLKGLYEITGTISTRINAAVLGSAGGITATNSYLTNLVGYTLNIERDAKVFNSLQTGTAIAYQEALPGLIRWGGSYTAHLDGTTVIKTPNNANVPYSATFLLIDDTTDHTVAGSIITEGLAANVRIGDIAEVTYNFTGTGALTAAGSGSWTRLFPTSPIPNSAAGSLVLTAATGRTYTFDAFWTKITIGVQPTEKVSVDIDFRGTGALTIA